MHAERRTALAVALALATALAVTAGCVLTDAHSGTDGQVGLDTAAAGIGMLLGYLLFGRFRESRLLRDLLLCAFLLLLGVGNAIFSAVPRSLGQPALQGASSLAGVTAGALLAVATWVPAWRWRWSTRAGAVALGAGGLVVVVACWLLGALLPRDGYGSIDTFGATPEAALSITQLLAALLFAVGAWGAARRATDRLLQWLTGAAVLAAAFRIDYALSQGIGDGWSTAATALRVAFYGVLVAAAGAEIGGYWRTVAEVAALEERRRIARDLHDGVAQEVAFAATQARLLAEASEHPARARLVAAAAERALDESRRAIAALTRPLDEPLEVTVAQCAEEVCGRFDKDLQLDLEPGLDVPGEVREALVRIVREAVGNAARHSEAQQVTVRLRRDSGAGALLLRVEDDGRGFDVDDLAHLSGRFGLISMRERAEAVGGTFTIVSRLQGGTAIEVALP